MESYKIERLLMKYDHCEFPLVSYYDPEMGLQRRHSVFKSDGSDYGYISKETVSELIASGESGDFKIITQEEWDWLAIQ